jgi:hypothetical protein
VFVQWVKRLNLCIENNWASSVNKSFCFAFFPCDAGLMGHPV